MSINIFIENMINLVCSRCTHDYSKESSWHHNGALHDFLQSDIKIDEIFFKNYFNDIEHGFFHAFCCCYISYILTNYNNKQIGFEKNKNITKNRDKKTRWILNSDEHPLNIQLIASLLLHDFLKCNDFSQEEHDKMLKKYYSKLLPETYYHSNPTPENENKLLIKCDRMELRRYSDYKEWVDKRHKDLYDDLNEEQRNLIEEFYENIRPTLEYFYKNRNEIFIRHGLEDVNKADFKGNFPPENSFLEISNKNYPIEIDRITNLNPIPNYNIRINKRIINYIKRNTKVIEKFNCSNHEFMFDYSKVKGYITYKEFIKKGGVIVNSGKRDHLYATSNINIKKWKFIYTKLVNKEDSQIKSLRENNIGIISQELLYNFMGLVKILQDRMIVLRKTC